MTRSETRSPKLEPRSSTLEVRSSEFEAREGDESDPSAGAAGEIIQVDDLSKIYRIYSGPRDLLRELIWKRRFHEPLRALQNISFSVTPGESFGLVGDNGSGKSTLLKILAGTCLPSSGEVTVNGQVSALLELGAGFHPEFTGLENIYFSGALMGLTKEQIEARQEGIIEFSELGEFIHQPVRTYSSGMYLRLGFSVATGFDSEILIIDEALAVGDQSFQKKCLDRIQEFREEGKTILFCSHSLHYVKVLCSRTLWLDHGRARALGASSEVVGRYQDYSREKSKPGRSGRQEPDRRLCWIESARILDSQTTKDSSHRFQTGDSIELEIWARFDTDFPGEPGIGLAVIRNDGVVVHTTATCVDDFPLLSQGEGRYVCRCRFPHLSLLSGRFSFTVFTTDQHRLHAYDVKQEVEPFEVTHPEADYGLIRLEHEWRHPPG